jgi:hypothetical protein
MNKSGEKIEKKRRLNSPARRSPRHGGTAERPTTRGHLNEDVAFADKLSDGFQERRMQGTLKNLTHYQGGSIYRGIEKLHDVSEGGVGNKTPNKETAEIRKVRDAVNGYKRRSGYGGDPCYDTFDELGSSVYLYSLPVNLVRGLLQGFKTEQALKHFKTKSAKLSSHTGTHYLFLHWPRGVPEDFGDWKKHPFIRDRPDLETTIQSLGNWIRDKVILNKALTCYQPGLLANKSVAFQETTHPPVATNPIGKKGGKLPPPTPAPNQDAPNDHQDPHARLPTTKVHNPQQFKAYQPPHWDFTGWRKCAAKDMPWILHVPLCQEGMMLHVWPTTRDAETHADEFENFKLGKPEYIHVAFGDALLLRADVAHGGCFGSQGNSRFHMVLRKPQGECLLGTNHLHFVDWSVDDSVFEEARKCLDKLGSPADYFRRAVADGSKTVLAYIKRVKAAYPCHPSWSEGLFEPAHFPETQK